MKRTFSAVAVVALAMAVSAGAAVSSQEKIPPAQKPSATAPDDKSVTITGCVTKGVEPGSFILTQADVVALAGATPRKPLVLSLLGTEADITKHVGHSVTVTGSYPTPAVATGTAGTEKPAPAPAIAAEADAKPTARAFTVKTITMVASSCTAEPIK